MIRTACILVSAATLAACASVPPPPPPPSGEGMLRSGPTSKSSINKRQYLDERTGRYYYFDPKRGAYFWEDGRPKG